jgi:hypothetical protein
MVSIAGVVAAGVALVAPTTGAAQSGEPFPNDQQPIADQYGLPPLDHHASHTGGGGGAGVGTGTGGGGAGATTAGSALRASDVRRGERARNGTNAAGSGATSRARVGVSEVPPRSSLTGGADPRDGFDVLLIVLAGGSAAALLLTALMQLTRPGRPSV